MKYPSYEFLTSKWFVHSRLVNLGNPFEALVHHLLIRGMSDLSHQDGVPMVSIIIHWTRLTMSYDIRLLSSHDFTKLLYYIVSQPWENIGFLSKLAVALTYRWDYEVIIYFFYGLSHYWWNLVATSILNRSTIIFHRL